MPPHNSRLSSLVIFRYILILLIVLVGNLTFALRLLIAPTPFRVTLQPWFEKTSSSLYDFPYISFNLNHRVMS